MKSTVTTITSNKIIVLVFLLLATSMAFAQAGSVGLTAAATTTLLPDGKSVPMWGYSCGAVGGSATCSALNTSGPWSPVLIQVAVPSGSNADLTINLTNSLPASVPTSLSIVGVIGGGAGAGKMAPSPTHAAQGTTWPIANDTTGATFNPPPQGPRVQSFGTEVASGGAVNGLRWPSIKPGTYLIESGTHPSIQVPMGLYGVLVVTTAPSSGTPGTAYAGVSYDADAVALLSEIDATQNQAVATAVGTPGFSETAARVLRDYVTSVVPAVDASGNVIGAGTGYHAGDLVVFTGGGFATAAQAHVSQVDGSGAITAVQVDNPGKGYSSAPAISATRSSGTGTNAQLVAALSLSGTMCSDGAGACYPPAVNYDPRYYLVNGKSFDATNTMNSLLPVSGLTAASTNGVLVRFVNAGSRMHIPSVVGLNMSLIAEDANILPGTRRVQNEVFLPAGKVYDVIVNPAPVAGTYAIFDRQLSLSTNNQHDGGMQAYLGVNGGTPPVSTAADLAQNDQYFVQSGGSLTISDVTQGVIANDINVYGVTVVSGPVHGTLTLNSNGTFTYVNSGTVPDSFVYRSTNGTGSQATVSLNACLGTCMGGAPTANADSYTSNLSARIQVSPPGVLGNDTDPQNHPLTASAATNVVGGTVTLNPDGSFTAAPTTPPVGNNVTASVTFQYTAVNSQKTASAPTNVTVTFNGGSGLVVRLWDAPSLQPGKSPVQIQDYRWIIEEDRTFQIDPACQVNSTTRPSNCPPLPAPSLGTNFHTSHMPTVAAGCVGTVACESGQTIYDSDPNSPTYQQHVPAVCDVGNGVCRVDAQQQIPTDPSEVHLDPTKHYYISVLPGDAGNTFTSGAGAPISLPDGSTRAFNIALDCPSGPGGPDFAPGTGTCGHGLSGAPIAPGQMAVDVKLQQTPFPTAKIAVFIFEDDDPLNGENDAGGGVDVLAPNEPGLGSFEVTLLDQAGGFGDSTGQPTYDMFNMPLSNSLAGTIDPATHQDACPISPTSKDGLVGMIVTCPKFESDGKTLSPLAGQAVIANLYPGLYEVFAQEGADRIAKGEEWIQTNTLDGTMPHEAFIKAGEPAYFQEFGPAGYHVAIGFANPKIINDRKPGICSAATTGCNNTVNGKVTTARLSRTPDERLYSSGDYTANSFTQCYVSLGEPDDLDFAFTKCNPDGTFSFSGIPDGQWRVTVFDQWNDLLVDGLSTPVFVGPNARTAQMEIPMQQWRTNVFTRSFVDLNGDGVSNVDSNGNPTEPGLPLLPTNIRFRDGSYSNFNNTDLNGYAGFNEIFPYFNWLVLEADTTRYKQTGVHVVYDAGGPADGTPGGGNSVIGDHLANTKETNSVPTDLRIPGAVYCDNADCKGFSIANGPASSATSNLSTGRIDPPWITTEAWQGFLGNYEFVEFGKAPFASGENGGIHGEVIYASTRPFDDPSLLLHTSWTPDVPGVRINLYQEGIAPDGTKSLQLVDTTKTTSWDDFTQGFRNGAVSGAVTSISVTNGGSGYGTITSLTLINGGSGYTSTPTVTITGGGTGATAVATVSGGIVTGVTLTSPGVGYSNPFVTFTGGGGSGATATATAPAPQVTVSGSGTGAAATAVVSGAGAVSFIRITDQGTGYTNATVLISGGGGSGAMAAVSTGSAVPNMSCPGQDPNSMFFFTLENSPQFLSPTTPLPYSSQFKCYDGMAILNQVQPAPYDGMYKFPSVTGTNPTTGKPLTGAAGTNCTICVANPVDGLPMLPAGKYVVEMIVPPGYELVKEEDKNILIGDNYIAPVTQQFAGLGSIFILPDQAELSGLSNPNNPQNPTQTLGRTTFPSHEGDTGSVEVFWPCVGQSRIVPDYISLFPQSKEVAPFAGATRNLCDRKEVTLTDQTSVLAKFWVFSSTHKAAKYTGLITDDLSSEFDPFSPQFGEKFAVPNLPVSFKDFNGVEISRVYSDQWGAFNGVTYSTWEVNPPNPTGYAPQMFIACMNDPGPIPDPNHPGQMMTDPLYNPAYSQFCYEWAFMPGQTAYMDTPVVPTEAFADGYNLPDCAYPDATPAIKSVTGDPLPGGGNGPWVSAATSSTGQDHLITINALGDQTATNHTYSGPAATTAPFNQRTIVRHYGFGQTQGNGTVQLVNGNTTINAIVNSWSDSQIVIQTPASLPLCAVQQRGTGNGGARCGELVITAGNGKQSIDAITITVGGKAPTYVNGENSTQTAIQSAIDSATPGDMIIVGPGTYYELLLMWKPVRLQGVGAASVTINANPHPVGKLDPWRRQVNCLFGLALDGTLLNGGGVYDPTGTYTCPAAMQGAADPLPLEGIVGWDTTQNGNLAELLQEPSLMGAYEGAAITVVGKGETLSIGPGSLSPEGDFPPGSRLLTVSDCSSGQFRFASNFYCNPSRIDGLSITNSSQGGGGIFVHGWAHNIEIANNRIFANAGTLSGGITIGQGEFPDPVITGGTQQAYLFDTNVRVHHNNVTGNSSIGDELFAASPSAAGGVTFCTGSDYYHFNYNWVCGSLTTGDGGGVVHQGTSYNGDISHNWILFNQSTNPTLPTHGGGLAVLGAPPDGFQLVDGVLVECGSTTDADCPPGLSDGTGPGLVIDSNLIMGNSAESGSGGGLRLQSVNGAEVSRFPTAPGNWYSVTVTNNIIADNVAGWDGGGVSMQDALAVNFINNTVISNDSTASSGVLFNTVGAPQGSVPPPGCDPNQDPTCAGSQITTSDFLPAGLVTMQNTPNLISSFPAGGITCPAGHPHCAQISYPSIENDLFWQNRSFHIDVGTYGSGLLNQQHLVTLNPTLNQTAMGACMPGAIYWDIGVRGDKMTSGTAGHDSGFKLSPINSILDQAADYGPSSGAGNTHNLSADPQVVHQYCNGSRVPPENGGLGYDVPPGISDATLPNPVFNLTPSATVDEGNNWINMAYGPLTLTNLTGVTLGNYSINGNSPAIDAATVGNPTNGFAPNHDFFGTHRPQGRGIDIGAVEFVGSSAAPAVTLTALTSTTFPDVTLPTTAATAPTLDFRLSNAGPGTFTITNVTVGAIPFSRTGTGIFPTGAPNCGGTLASGATCTIRARFFPTTPGTFTGSVSVTGTGPGGVTDTVTGSPMSISGTAGRGSVTFSLGDHTNGVTFTGGAGTGTLAFGTQPVGSTASATLILTNTGTAPFVFQIGDTVAGLRFAKGTDLCTGGTLAVNATCSIVVTFNPNSTTGRTGTLTVRDTAAGNPQTVSLTGN